MIMGILYVLIVITIGVSMEMVVLCLVVGLLVLNVGQWQMKHNMKKKSVHL
jgi:hypothetical protein